MLSISAICAARSAPMARPPPVAGVDGVAATSAGGLAPAGEGVAGIALEEELAAGAGAAGGAGVDEEAAGAGVEGALEGVEADGAALGYYSLSERHKHSIWSSIP